MAKIVVIDIDKIECVSWDRIPKGFTDSFADGVAWVLENLDSIGIDWIIRGGYNGD